MIYSKTEWKFFQNVLEAQWKASHAYPEVQRELHERYHLIYVLQHEAGKPRKEDEVDVSRRRNFVHQGKKVSLHSVR